MYVKINVLHLKNTKNVHYNKTGENEEKFILKFYLIHFIHIILSSLTILCLNLNQNLVPDPLNQKNKKIAKDHIGFHYRKWIRAKPVRYASKDSAVPMLFTTRTVVTFSTMIV